MVSFLLVIWCECSECYNPSGDTELRREQTEEEALVRTDSSLDLESEDSSFRLVSCPKCNRKTEVQGENAAMHHFSFSFCLLMRNSDCKLWLRNYASIPAD